MVLTARQVLFFGALILSLGVPANCQDKTAAERAIQLALEGKCAEAMSLLTQVLPDATPKELKRKVGKAGVRCSMLLNQQANAGRFLTELQQTFPHDPD